MSMRVNEPVTESNPVAKMITSKSKPTPRGLNAGLGDGDDALLAGRHELDGPDVAVCQPQSVPAGGL